MQEALRTCSHIQLVLSQRDGNRLLEMPCFAAAQMAMNCNVVQGAWRIHCVDVLLVGVVWRCNYPLQYSGGPPRPFCDLHRAVVVCAMEARVFALGAADTSDSRPQAVEQRLCRPGDGL